MTPSALRLKISRLSVRFQSYQKVIWKECGSEFTRKFDWKVMMCSAMGQNRVREKPLFFGSSGFRVNFLHLNYGDDDHNSWETGKNTFRMPLKNYISVNFSQFAINKPFFNSLSMLWCRCCCCEGENLFAPVICR